MNVLKLIELPNNCCEIHGVKLSFEINLSKKTEHYFLTESGKLLCGEVLFKTPLVYLKIVEISQFELFKGLTNEYRNTLYKELNQLGFQNQVVSYEKLLDDQPINFTLNYDTQTIAIFQAEQLFTIENMTFYKSLQQGWYIASGRFDSKLLYVLDEDTTIEGKLWYLHLPSSFQKKLSENNLKQLYDFPFPTLHKTQCPSMPAKSELSNEIYKDCRHFVIHNDEVELNFFGMELIADRKVDCPLRLFYTPKDKLFHALTTYNAYYTANSLAELIFSSSQDKYGTQLYEMFKESNYKFPLTLEQSNPFTESAIGLKEIKLSELFKLQSSLYTESDYYHQFLPVVYGSYEPIHIECFDANYYSDDETYKKHVALLKNSQDEFVLIRFNEFNLDHYSVKQKGYEKYDKKIVGATRIYSFKNTIQLIDFLFSKVVLSLDLRGVLAQILQTYPITQTSTETKVFK